MTRTISLIFVKLEVYEFSPSSLILWSDATTCSIDTKRYYNM